LIQGTDGALYGTASQFFEYRYGTVFKLNPDGTGFTVIASGDWTYTGLLQGTDGELYGTAAYGGSNEYGAVFKLNPDGTGFTVLANFDSTTGRYPYAGLIQGTDGALYGTAQAGGSNGSGTVFKLNPDGTGFTVLANLSSDFGCLAGTDTAPDGTVCVEPAITEVAIDIKPGSDTNPLNPGSRSVIPVAILTTATFDATTVDPSTVHFGRSGSEAAVVQSALADVNGDGRPDLILHFRTQETDIQCGDTSASLTGDTTSGQAIKGSDAIVTVGCKSRWGGTKELGLKIEPGNGAKLD
jgi:uncharacterized repeat protein (TIGR03803 family)